MLGHKRGCARAGASWRKGGREWDSRCLDNRDPGVSHLAPHALLIPLDFLVRNGLQCDLARDVPRHRLAGGSSRGREGERGSGERVGGGGWEEAWMGRLRGAQRGLSVLVVPAMSRAAKCDDHDVGFVTCLQHRFRVYTPERFLHVP